MTPRLTSAMLANALIRCAAAEGGFGAVLAKGDVTAGSIVVVLLERGENPRIFERILQTDGHYGWTAATRSDGTAEEVPGFIARRRQFDPDLWVLELDIPSPERFAEQMDAIG